MRSSQLSNTCAIGGALGLMVVIATIFACGGDLGPDNTIHGCPVVFGANYPMNSTIRVDKPAVCPFNTTQPVYTPYAADATFAVGTTDRQVALMVSDRNGQESQVYIDAAWSTVGGSGDDLVQTSGTYLAAEGGFFQDGGGFYTNGFDNAHNQVSVGGQWREAIATLNYNYGFPSVDIYGPSTNGAYLQYTLDAEVKDASMVPPISYEWSTDGETTGQTGPEYSGQSGDPNSSQSISVHAVDANGLEHTADYVVTACDGYQIDC